MLLVSLHSLGNKIWSLQASQSFDVKLDLNYEKIPKQTSSDTQYIQNKTMHTQNKHSNRRLNFQCIQCMIQTSRFHI